MSVLKDLVEALEGCTPGRRAVVAVDGPDAAGKTTLARALAERAARHVVQVSVDAWHHPRAVRLRRGADSPEGYYRDSFDVEALVRECVAPFRSGATRVRTAGFDHLADREVDAWSAVGSDTVLLLDGVFLLRPELRPLWDLSVHLHVPEPVTLARAVQRDVLTFGSEEAVRHRYARRYLPGQALYRAEAAPADHADVVLDNSDPDRPVVLRWPGSA